MEENTNTPAAGNTGDPVNTPENAGNGTPPAAEDTATPPAAEADSARSILSADADSSADDSPALTIPAADASPEDVETFYQALGKPETVDQYDISAPADLPADFQWNEKSVRDFADFAFQQNLTRDQFKAALDFHTQFVRQQYSDTIAAHNAAADKVEAKLKSEFGDQYESMLRQANQALRHFDVGETLKNAGLLADEKIIRAFYSIGKTFSETRLAGADLNNVNSAQSRYEELTAPDSPYWKQEDPKHNEVVREVSSLLRILDLKRQ